MEYYQGKPLTFIGQFKLSELAPYDRDKELPAEGMLYFFFEVNDYLAEDGSWQILFFSDEEIKLSRIQHPVHEGFAYPIKALPAHRLNFETILTLRRHDGELKEFGLNKSEFDSFREMFYQSHSRPQHQFLGYPYLIQNELEWDCVVRREELQKLRDATLKHPLLREQQIALIETKMKEWKFLFQIDADDSLGLELSDLGTLYICIPKGDLARKYFDNMVTILQSY